MSVNECEVRVCLERHIQQMSWVKSDDDASQKRNKIKEKKRVTTRDWKQTEFGPETSPETDDLVGDV
jgi:hypothetical protein